MFQVQRFNAFRTLNVDFELLSFSNGFAPGRPYS
jgi:hypothetical protein